MFYRDERLAVGGKASTQQQPVLYSHSRYNQPRTWTRGEDPSWRRYKYISWMYDAMMPKFPQCEREAQRGLDKPIKSDSALTSLHGQLEESSKAAFRLRLS